MPFWVVTCEALESDREAGWMRRSWGHTWNGLTEGSLQVSGHHHPPEKVESVRESGGVRCKVETW